MFDLNSIKSLIVVLGMAVVAFVLVRPLALRFMRPETFVRRRNVWFALTVTAFLSPSFWLYAVVAIPLLWWAQRRDDNPLALYGLTLFAIPNVNFFLPTVVIGQLFDLTQYRILAFVILVPAIFRGAEESRVQGRRVLEPLDLILLAFLLLQVALTVPYDTFTTTMRRSFLAAIDVFVLFYAFSRLSSREKLADAMMGFFLACFIMALVALVEYTKTWLLYAGLSEKWGNPNVFSWLFRADRLRAQAAAEHSINLGYQLAMALGFFLYLRTRLKQKAVNWLIVAILCAGLIATSARGPWVTAVAAVIVVTLLRPNAGRNLFGASVVAVLAFTLMYFTPLRESVLDRLPFIGNSDQDTVEYRRQLAELSWTLILQNPLFGDPFVTARMESLRQGQGIIDIVNGYIYTMLFNGIVGLTLIVTVFLGSLYLGIRATLEARRTEPDGGMLVTSLVACMVASLIYSAAAGYGPTTYLVCGLLVSAWNILSNSARARSASRTADPTRGGRPILASG